MIPLHDVIEQNRSIRSELDAAVARVLDSGILIGGTEVGQFECSFAEYLNVSHVVGCGNATDGFEVAYKALDFDSGAEVIIPANAHVSPALAALNVGLTPTFCDADPIRMLIDPSSAEQAITPQTKAIVAVHLYGRVCPMDELIALCNRHDLVLIEDFSQAQGATYQGKKVGGFGKINVCSFYPTKPLGGLGDGGAITTNDPEKAERCRVLAQYGWNPRDNATLQGQNSRLDAIQAAILSVKLNHLDSWNDDRIQRAGQLTELIQPIENVKVDELICGDICHLLPIRTSDRKNVVEQLNTAGLAYGIHFPIPIHQQELFNTGQTFPVAEKCCNEVFSIPLHIGIIDLLK